MTQMKRGGIAVDCVLNIGAQLGEGAIWSAQEQVLYWVDIPAGRLCRFDPSTGENRVWEMGRSIGCFALRRSRGAVVALADGIFTFDFESNRLESLGDPESHLPMNRFNDGTVDPRGRFYAGTMPDQGGDAKLGPRGALYRVDADRKIHRVMDGFFVINGLAFSPTGTTAYVSDSFPPVRTIWAFDYDLDDAAWTNRRVFLDTRGLPGRPDGGAMDSAGCYWMAGVGGWQLVRITPQGKVDMQIPMPVEKPTRIAFGGKQLDTLYVTSIGKPGITPGSEGQQPDAGGIFALKVPGVSGLEFPRCAV